MNEFKTESGLTVLIERFPGTTTGIDLCTGFGSVFERENEAGIAHFLEHVFFSGSKLGRKKPFVLVEGKGGELNAFTSKEETHFFSRIISSEIKAPLKVFSDCCNQGLFKEKDVELEKKIILNEIKESKDNPVRRVFNEFIELSLPKPFNRPTIGFNKTVNSINPKKLRRAFEENYYSKNSMLGIATSLPEKKVLPLVDKLFKERKGKAQRKPAFKPAKKAEERKSFTKTEQAHCCLGFPAMNARHPDYFAFELISNYLGGGLSSRLVQEIREKRGLSYAISANYSAEENHGLFTVYFSTNPLNITKTKKLIEIELERMQKKRLSGLDLRRAKKQLIGRNALDLENSFNMARALIERKKYGHGSLAEQEEKIKSLTIPGIQRVAKEYLKPKNYFFSSLLPKKQD